MKTNKPIVAWFLCFVFLAALAVPSSHGSRSTADWTFMVYLDGDNNLDAYGAYSLGMMEEVGSTPGVNVLVLWDRLYEPAYMYKVIKGGVEQVQGFTLNGQEVNMGDPITLETFVDFSAKKFRADHYVLVIWDHGDDVSGCCWDEHPAGHLTHSEVAAALSNFRFDIIAFDACLMAMVEVAYEYNQDGLSAKYLVGSENYVPENGYPYNTILAGLTNNPSMSELELAQSIVNDYADFYKPRAHFNGGVMGTLSAIDLDEIVEVVADLSAMTDALMTNMEDNHEMISNARGTGMLPWSEYGWDRFIDLPTFVEDITSTTTDPTIKSAGEALQVSLSHAIIAVGNTEAMDSAGARGMGIWFPSSYHTWGSTPYTDTKFAAQGWLDFLYAYWNDHHS